MKKIQCYDEKGNYIDSLTQWDQNQIIYIDNFENGTVPNVHFAFSGNDASWQFSNITSLSNGQIKVSIPNSLMQSSGRLHLFFYYGSSTSYTTKYYSVLTIKEKPRPEEYTYIDDGRGVNVTQLQNELNAIRNELSTMNNYINRLENRITALE